MKIGSVFICRDTLVGCQEKHVVSKISIPGIFHHIFIMVDGVGFSGIFVCFFPAGNVFRVGKNTVCVVTQNFFQFCQVDFGIILLRSTELRDNQCAFIYNLVGKFIRDTVFAVCSQCIGFSLNDGE